jgi:LL-diaminopimelate aminotransferase
MPFESWLPEGGANLFQTIKKVCQEAEAGGQKLYRLSIGQPSGPALESARQHCADQVMSPKESWHEYQDNGFLPYPDWAMRFCQAHAPRVNLKGYGAELDYLPIPGIKPMLGLVMLACGAEQKRQDLHVMSMTAPGYPVPRDWAGYLGVTHGSFSLNPKNAFLPNLEDEESIFRIDLAMMNLPHNPSGQIATYEYWREVCEFCSKKGIRLVNDGAYLALSHDKRSRALAEVAVDFPGLEWIELFSASKSIANGTGWRIGGMVGSPDFVNDVKKIKGNTDSGFFAPAAAGALFALENDQAGVAGVGRLYEERLKLLVPILKERGLRLAVNPGAGFFSLWESPKYAFGRKMVDAEDFNLSMIQETGIVGVHFDPYIRFAVCGPVENWTAPIKQAFDKADVSY